MKRLIDKYPPHAHMVDRLRHWAEVRPDWLAFTFLTDGESEEVTLDYVTLDARARRIAARLEAMELSGERALLLYPPGIDFLTAFWGCLYAGVVAAPAYPPRKNRNMLRIQAISDDADAKVALTTKEWLPRIHGMLADAPHLKQLAWLATDALPEGSEDDWRCPDLKPDSLAVLQYTSGSTGSPKGVMLSHGNLIHNAGSITESFSMDPEVGDLGAYWLPMYHDMGLIGGVLGPVFVGGQNVLISPNAFLQKPLRWLNLISKYKGTISGGPNFAYQLCLEKITPEERAQLDLSSWKVAFNGAEPVRAGTINRFCEVFAECGFRRSMVYPCYGLAEATLIVTGGVSDANPIIRSYDGPALDGRRAEPVDPSADSARLLVGSGASMHDQFTLVVDPDTHEALPDRRVGEIWVAGPSVAHGYWKNDEDTARCFGAKVIGREEPFMRTGDLGFFDEKELFVTGRIKDMLIIRGVNKYPQDIEATAGEAHVILRPDAAAVLVEAAGKERLVIVCEANRDKRDKYDAAIAAIRTAVMQEHDVPVEAVALIRARTIPRTSSGKIQRHACAREFLTGDLSELRRWVTWERPDAEAVASDRLHHANRFKTLSGDDMGHQTRGTAWQAAGTAEPSGDMADAASQADTGRAEINPAVAEAVYAQVKAIAKERAGEVTLDTNIVELGLDSLERMEIANEIEQTFGGRFPEDVLSEIETCREVILAVQTYLGTTPLRKLGDARNGDPGGDRALLEAARRPIDPATCDISQWPEYRQLRQVRDLLTTAGAKNPYFTVSESVTRDTTVIAGRPMISFATYNYLGMCGHPRVTAAAKAGLDKYGTSCSASRLVAGERTVHGELETAVARHVGTEAAVCFVSGHATNETTVGHLVGRDDLIIHDALSHNSIVQGALLSGARRRPFAHNDYEELDKALTQIRGDYRRALVIIEGVYSMDGDYPDLPRFVEVAKRHHALLMVDEAHSIGVMGEHGRGLAEHFGVNPANVDVWMGTLSKAFGSTGGYIAGSAELVDYLRYTAPGFVFSCGLPPASAAAALESLAIVGESNEPVTRCHKNAALFLSLAKEAGLNTGASRGTPVIPVITGNSLLALKLADAMFQRGVNVPPILYPAVEEKAARLRFFVTAAHSEEQIRYAVQAVAESLAALQPQGAFSAAV